MNIFNTKYKNNNINLNDSSVKYGFFNNVKLFNFNYQYLTENIGILNGCIKLVSDAISKLDLNLIYTDEKGVLRDAKENNIHYLLKFKPNPFMNSFQFWNSMVNNMLYNGDSYVNINKTKTGLIYSFEPIANEQVNNIKLLETGELNYNVEFERENEKYYENIRSRNILHFKINSQNGVNGNSYYDALKDNLESLQVAQRSYIDYYKNGMLTTKYIKSTVNIENLELFLKAKEKFESLYTGAENTNKPVILPEGFELENIELDFKDEIFIKTLDYNSRVICSFFGISPQLLNVGEQKTSSYESDMLNFYSIGLQPIITMIEAELNQKLLTKKQLLNGYKFKFDINKLFKYDINKTLDYHNKMFYNGIDSARDIINDMEILNVDRFENDDAHIKQSNLSLLSQIDNEALKEIKKNDNLNV